MIKYIKRLFKMVGPGFIMAAVVLGPGSITISSDIGATYGYNFLWVVLIAAIFMVGYTNMSTRFGVLHDRSILSLIAKKYGKWFSVLIGISSFLASLSFQFGNNIGAGMGMESLTGIDDTYWLFLFTPLAMLLVFLSQNLYKALEKMMLVMVVLMIAAFAINLIFIKPEFDKIAVGFIPRYLAIENMNPIIALVGTTLSLNGALYQSYLVQSKGWKLKDKSKSIRDSNLGVFLLATISVLVIITAAATLNPFNISVNSATDMAIQLESILGNHAKYIFSLGFISAAFSSLIINAVIGGGLLADGLGMGKSMNEKMPKLFTGVILVTGMIVSIYVANNMGNPVYSLILAQASSMLSVPLIGVGLLLVVNSKKVMGIHKNSPYQNLIGLMGFMVICILVFMMFQRLINYFAAL
ncbi:Nramp family divalent metal transporter [Flagellimonas algicola]|uniref:Divalent metal cation transporter n=1 Tax=Flagellimonas algicola TaxID=2583815 RepID=A0ABY2WHE5_9FLAO|nr:Nramp family divalent metal transporter [Allomuricauda algicola]TMU50727.1 divalent metal cation transporter [Allomuricauda algicola]